MWLNDTVYTLFSVAVPIAFILYAWYKTYQASVYTALIVAFGAKASQNLSHVYSLFDQQFLGGSVLLPCIFLCIALCLKRFGVRETLYHTNVACFALLMLTLLQMDKPVYSLTDFYSAHSGSVRDSGIVAATVYFGGLLILATRKYLDRGNPYIRCGIPVFTDIMIMTPLTWWAAIAESDAFYSNGYWIKVLLLSLLVRILVPILVLVPVFITEEDKTKFDLKE